jgi:hypothetical protein
MGTSGALDESVGPGVAPVSSPSAGPSVVLGASEALDESVGSEVVPASPASVTPSKLHGQAIPPYAATAEGPQSVASPTPTAPAAKSAARDKRPASTRVEPISTLAVAPQNRQIASPRLT